MPSLTYPITDLNPARSPAARQRATAVLVAHALVLVAAAAYFQARLWGGASVAGQAEAASMALLLLCAWSILSWKMATGSIFDPYGLFLLAAIPFHAGYSLLWLLGEADPVVLSAGVSQQVLGQTLLFVNGSLGMLHLGALMARAWTDRIPAARPASDRVQDADLRLVGWVLLSLVAVPLVLEFRGYLDAVFVGGYKDLFLQRQNPGSASAGGTLVDLITPFFIPGVMFLLAGSRKSRIGRWVATGSLLLYSAVYLYIGFRAYALIPIVVLAWAWHHCIRPLPLRTLGLAGLAFFLIVAPLVRTFRGLSGAERLSPEAILQAYGTVENPVLRLIGELGSSVFTISYTSQLVPSVRPHEWGLGYLRAALNALPVIDIPNAYGDSGVWLAWEIRPEWAAGGFAYGYSFIAEAYLNFGFLGGPLFLLALGIALVLLSRWAAETRNPARIAFVASFLPLLLFFVRGESVNLARPILWYSLIPFAAVHLLRRYRSRIGLPGAGE
jgi:oligosaccharide repeat unit polymerase